MNTAMNTAMKNWWGVVLFTAAPLVATIPLLVSAHTFDAPVDQPVVLAAAQQVGARGVQTNPDLYTGPVVVRGCVIRFDTQDAGGHTVPRIHVNSAHKCNGAESVSVAPNGDLLVTAPDSRNVVTMSAHSDETLTEKGITCGSSGGGKNNAYRCYDRSGTKIRADSDQLFHPYANLWLLWVNQGDVPPLP